jgi:hypothetical protein
LIQEKCHQMTTVRAFWLSKTFAFTCSFLCTSTLWKILAQGLKPPNSYRCRPKSGPFDHIYQRLCMLPRATLKWFEIMNLYLVVVGWCTQNIYLQTKSRLLGYLSGMPDNYHRHYLSDHCIAHVAWHHYQ